MLKVWNGRQTPDGHEKLSGLGMFRRRHSPSLLSNIRGILWPERGFRRLFAYLLQRIARMPGSSLSIAVGVACGVSVSFTPFIGFHFLFGAFLAYILRGNIIASAIGTIVGNPWTFPFIISADFSVGSWAWMQLGMVPPSVNLSISEIIADPMSNLIPLLMPMMLGGLIMGVFAWFTSFGMVYCALIWWRGHRARRLAERRRRRYYKISATEVVSKNGGDRKSDLLSEFERGDDDVTKNL